MIGLLDSQGEIILPPEYSTIRVLPGRDMAIAKTGDKAMLVSFDGTTRTLDVDVYLSSADESERMLVVNNGLYGYMNVVDFSLVIPCRYSYASNFIGEYATVELDGEYGVIDRQGNTVIPFSSGWKKVFRNGTFAVADPSSGTYCLSDCNGNTMNNTFYTSIEQSGDGYMVALSKYGFLDASGKELLPPTFDYCFNDVYGMDNCFVAKKGNGSGSHSIVVLGEMQDIDLSYLLLKNEVTPRIKAYSQFVKEGLHEGYARGSLPPEMDSVNSLNGYIHTYKLYSMGSGAPVMYYHAQPFVKGGSFPLSYSGFYSLKDGQLSTLVTGHENGGSAGGDFVCLWQDKQTLELHFGEYYHLGGFIGRAAGGSVYENNNGSAVPVISFGYVTQDPHNYKEGVLLENACLFYNADGEPHTEDSILLAIENDRAVSEYLVNGERTTIENYREVATRYTRLTIWF
jgi:hypothetical protein